MTISQPSPPVDFSSGEFLALDSLAYAGKNDGYYGLEDLQKAIDKMLLSEPSSKAAKQIIEAGKLLADNNTANDGNSEQVTGHAPPYHEVAALKWHGRVVAGRQGCDSN